MPAEPRAAKGRAPHRRDENARLAVLHAADDLLVERGFAGVTIEGIAGRAGVAKQTIYRWWTSKVDVLLDTLVEDAGFGNWSSSTRARPSMTCAVTCSS